jgi:hypothetical protein
MIYRQVFVSGGADSVLLWFQKRDTIATALQPFDLSLETVVQRSVHYQKKLQGKYCSPHSESRHLHNNNKKLSFLYKVENCLLCILKKVVLL